jgi:hypothetical protein
MKEANTRISPNRPTKSQHLQLANQIALTLPQPPAPSVEAILQRAGGTLMLVLPNRLCRVEGPQLVQVLRYSR